MISHKNISFFTSDEEYDTQLEELYGDKVLGMDPFLNQAQECAMEEGTLNWGHRGALVRYPTGSYNWHYRFAAIYHLSSKTWLINTTNIYIDFFEFMREKIIRNKYIPWRNG